MCVCVCEYRDRLSLQNYNTWALSLARVQPGECYMYIYSTCLLCTQAILKGQNRLMKFLSRDSIDEAEIDGESERPLQVEKKPPPLHVDVNTCNNDGATPLILATLNGHRDVAYTLLQYSANVRASDLKGLVCRNFKICSSVFE